MHRLLLIVSVFFLFALTVGVLLFMAPGTTGRTFEEVQAEGAVQPLIMAALMLCGVTFGAIYTELQEEGASAILAFKRALARPALYRALLVAPIVFAGVYAFARTTSDPIIVGIFAFQNGFFCEAVFRKSGDPTAKDPQI
jgi:hypothetical protein